MRALLIATAAGCLLGSPVCSWAQGAGDPTRAKPGDRIALRIAVAAVEDLQLDVNERGEILLPRVGRLVVIDLNEAGVRQAVVDKYRDVYRDPVIETRILRRVLVHGAAARPDVYYVDRFIGLTELVALSGGPSDRGHRRRLTMVRGTERREFDDWRRAPPEWHALQSGDEIIFADAPWLTRNSALVLSAAGLLVSIIVATGK